METNSNQKVSCIVNYAYEASEPDELSLRVGDVVRDVERLAGGWWRGELRGRRGMFPDNFVSVLTDSTPGRSSIQGRCRAVFSYQPANPDELPLCVGDVLDVLGEVEEGWWQGRRQGRVGVFPSNFVVLLDAPTVPAETAPALPPKPVKEQCLVLFPYTAVNEDELSLAEGELVTLVSRDAPDRGWWRGELRGKQGLFPDNFVQLLANSVPQDVEEKKPERPPSKTNAIYPILNKYSEKTASVKELTTSKISLHKENTVSKESTTQSTVTHTNKNESEKLIHSESVTDGTLDGQKKPPVPLKKSPTPTSGVGGLFSGLKNKMMSSSENLLSREKDKEKEKEKPAAPTVAPATVSNSNSNSSGEWDRSDRPDGALPSKQANTFDHVERNSILNDPRAGRVKAPRRRPPSQALRDDALSNGHSDTPPPPPHPHPPQEKVVGETGGAEGGEGAEIKPRAREWERHRAPWMDELKLSQAKKSPRPHPHPHHNNTDRISDVSMEEKRSTHSMEMSKSTSSISNRISVLESFEETKVRHSLDSKKDSKDTKDVDPKQTAQSPTAAGRTFTTMLEELKKPAPTPPAVSTRTHNDDKAPIKMEKTVTSEKTEFTKISSGFDRANTVEKMERTSTEERSSIGDKVSTLERRIQGKTEKCDLETLVTQLNNRISNLEKLLEVQNAKFTAVVEELTAKLNSEVDKRQALQAQVDKLAHCVTSV